jgi:hypothetical protein
MMKFFKEKVMTTKKLAVPKTKASVSATENRFTVFIEGDDIWGNEYIFSISSDGDVVLNDNHFSSKAEAAAAFEAIAAFLKK